MPELFNYLFLNFRFLQLVMAEAVVRTCSVKKVFLKISQYSQEKTCVGVSFKNDFLRMAASAMKYFP